MTLSDLASLGSFVSGAAVLASLIYLALQVRQAEKNQQAGTRIGPATRMLAFEGDSHVEWFEGNYQDYEADKKRRLRIAADQPHRIKYKRFART